jgi:uncharacterized membrane protein YdjX (TVP38/TMEM64 family)
LREEAVMAPAGGGRDGGGSERGIAAGAAAPRAGAGRLVWIAAIAVVLCAAVYFAGELRGAIQQVGPWIESLGVWAPVVYALFYAVGALLLLPGSVMTMLGGALFGLAQGTASVFVGATTGASLAFLVSRYVARDWVAGRVASRAGLAKIDRAVGEQGFRIVLLLRLSPLFPFNALNFMLGLTRVRFVDYVLASVGMLPGTLLYVYYGKLIGDVAQIAAGARPEVGGAGRWVVLGLGLVATLAVSVLVARLARRALDQELPQEQGA